MVRSKRLGAMASTRAMRAACSGWRRAANRNSEWIAARRAFRVRTLFPRSCSRWSRKAAISGASSSAMSSLLGVVARRLEAKVNSSRKVSL